MKVMISFIILVAMLASVIYAGHVQYFPPAICEALTIAIIVGGGLGINHLLNRRDA